MIISDLYKFSFIHIPKNGGTSIVTSLQSLHDLPNRFKGRGFLGEDCVYFDHLPLTRVAKDFPEIISRLETYETFATFRDPVPRFRSALFEYIRQVKHIEPANASKQLFFDAYQEVEDELIKRPHPIEWDLIFFRPQSDFIFLNGKQLIKNVLPIERLYDILIRISEITGQEFNPPHLNATLEYRHSVAAWLGGSRKFLRRILPRDHYAKARLLGRQVLMRPQQSEANAFVLDANMTNFVEYFYQEDFTFLSNLKLSSSEAKL